MHHGSYTILARHFQEYTALIYINATDHIIEHASCVHMMIQGSPADDFSKNATQIGFVVRKKEGKRRKKLLFTKAQEWPAAVENNCCRFSCDRTTEWLLGPTPDSAQETPVLDSSLFFGFYILLKERNLTPEQLLDMFQFEIKTFKVEADSVDHELEERMVRSGIYLRSRFVPKYTRFCCKTATLLDLRKVFFRGLSLEGDIMVCAYYGSDTWLLPDDKEWEVVQRTYPPRPYYSLDDKDRTKQNGTQQGFTIPSLVTLLLLPCISFLTKRFL